MRCPLHPEWSAPCGVNWILAAIYGFFLIIAIILAIVSAKMLRKIKKQIENDFLDATIQSEKLDGKNINIEENVEAKKNKTIFDEADTKRRSKPKKIIVEGDSTLKNKRKKSDIKQ